MQKLTSKTVGKLNRLPGFPPRNEFVLGSYLDETGVRAEVSSAASLPLTDNQTGDLRFSRLENQWYAWDGAAWQVVGGGGGGITAVTGTAPVQSSGGATPDISLADSGVVAASYGTASSVSQLTISAKGLVTSAASTPIQIAQSQVTNLTTVLSTKVTGPASSTTNAVALFSDTTGKLVKDGSQLTITGTAATSTVPLVLPDNPVNVNSNGPAVTTPSLRLTGEATGLVRANIQNASPATYTPSLGVVEDGQLVSFFSRGIPLPAPSTQSAGGLSITTSDDYSFLHVGKPSRYEYFYAGTTATAWSQGGALGSAVFACYSYNTGTPANTSIGSNYQSSPYGGLSSQIPGLNFYRSRGTFAAPTAVQTGDALGAVYFSGRNTSVALNGTNATSGATSAKIQSFAEQNFSGADAGAGLGFWTQANGTYTGDNLITQAPEVWINNAGNVGVGLGAGATAPWQPTQAHTKLQVAGPIATAVTTTSAANLNLDNTHSVVFVNATTNNVNVALPNAVGIAGRRYVVKRLDNNTGTYTVTVSSSGGTIEGIAGPFSLNTQYANSTFVSDGSNWWLIY
jgi:hypothetical protein